MEEWEREYRCLGRSGLQVSAVSPGSRRTFGQRVDDATTRRCMELAVEDNVQAVEVVEQLTEEVLARIEDILGNKP